MTRAPYWVTTRGTDQKVNTGGRFSKVEVRVATEQGALVLSVFKGEDGNEYFVLARGRHKDLNGIMQSNEEKIVEGYVRGVEEFYPCFNLDEEDDDDET